MMTLSRMEWWWSLPAAPGTGAGNEGCAPCPQLLSQRLQSLPAVPGHGVQGPDVFRFVVTAFAKQERGWLPDGPEVVPRDVRLSWTKAILVFLAALSLDVEESEPQVSADAIWALAQVGFTREQVRAAHRRELLRLSRLVWRDAQPVVATEGGG